MYHHWKLSWVRRTRITHCALELCWENQTMLESLSCKPIMVRILRLLAETLNGKIRRNPRLFLEMCALFQSHQRLGQIRLMLHIRLKWEDLEKSLFYLQLSSSFSFHWLRLHLLVPSSLSCPLWCQFTRVMFASVCISGRIPIMVAIETSQFFPTLEPRSPWTFSYRSIRPLFMQSIGLSWSSISQQFIRFVRCETD